MIVGTTLDFWTFLWDILQKEKRKESRRNDSRIDDVIKTIENEIAVRTDHNDYGRDW